MRCPSEPPEPPQFYTDPASGQETNCWPICVEHRVDVLCNKYCKGYCVEDDGVTTMATPKSTVNTTNGYLQKGEIALLICICLLVLVLIAIVILILWRTGKLAAIRRRLGGHKQEDAHDGENGIGGIREQKKTEVDERNGHSQAGNQNRHQQPKNTEKTSKWMRPKEVNQEGKLSNNVTIKEGPNNGYKNNKKKRTDNSSQLGDKQSDTENGDSRHDTGVYSGATATGTASHMERPSSLFSKQVTSSHSTENVDHPNGSNTDSFDDGHGVVSFRRSQGGSYAGSYSANRQPASSYRRPHGESFTGSYSENGQPVTSPTEPEEMPMLASQEHDTAFEGAPIVSKREDFPEAIAERLEERPETPTDIGLNSGLVDTRGMDPDLAEELKQSLLSGQESYNFANSK